MDLPWFLYMLECANGAIYTGITNDVAARFQAHCDGRGARYTRANPPRRILAVVEYENRSSAASAEYLVKKMSLSEKRSFIEDATPGATSSLQRGR